MSRALILLAVTALACRGNEATKPAPAGSAAPAAAPPPVVKASPPPATTARPELPAFGSAAGSGTIGDIFAAQEVDTSWKAQTENELQTRFRKMKHVPTDIDCKTSLCRLTIAGNDADVEATVDELQALRDRSQSLLLTAPVKDGDHLKVTAYLQFDRTAP
jgi:hypothetical protein